jgi:hypothetical protein
MGRKARISIIVLLLLVIFMPLVSHQGNSVCPSGPSVDILLAQTKQTAYVAPGQDGIVTFTGTVSANVPWPPESEGLEVRLKPDAGDWCVIAPPAMLFSKAEEQKSFSIRVYVPTGTSTSYPGQLSVAGTWRQQNTTLGGNIPPATAIIFIKQYTQIELNNAEGVISLHQGQKMNTTLMVHNMGNGDEKVRLEIFNLN